MQCTCRRTSISSVCGLSKAQQRANTAGAADKGAQITHPSQKTHKQCPLHPATLQHHPQPRPQCERDGSLLQCHCQHTLCVNTNKYAHPRGSTLHTSRPTGNRQDKSLTSPQYADASVTPPPPPYGEAIHHRDRSIARWGSQIDSCA